MERKWLEKLLIQSILYSFFLLVVFFVLKICFVLYSGVYHNAIGETESFMEYINAFLNGLRYDARHVAALSLAYFVLGLLFFWTRYRYYALWLYTLIVLMLTLFVGIAEIGFYEIYQDTFNSHLLGLIFDDREAILHTGLSGQYNITSKVFFWLFLCAFFMWIYTKIFHKIARQYGYDPLSSIRSRAKSKEPSLTSLILFIFYGLFMMVCINSAFSFKGVSLDQVLKPVQNNFLRQVSSGAFRDLYLVYRGYAKISKSNFSDYSTQRPSEVVEEYFGLTDKYTQYDLRELLKRHSFNKSEQKIDYVFYIVAESLSEWHFDKDFDELGLTSGLKSLVDNHHGVKIGVFLENAASTIKSMDVHLSGLFQTEIPVNSALGTLKPFVTAPAVIMNKLGYKSNFYYGGSGIWQKLDQYTLSQGFEKMYYNTHIIDNARFNGYSSPYEGLWGAYDHHLFSLVRDNVFKERHLPSFNMILTTSNHPPYDVPLEQFNAPLEAIDSFFKSHKEIKEKDKRQIAHIWYADKVITNFIHEVSRVLPNSLFVITGDHYDREYPKQGNTLRVSNSVPFIIYSPTLEIKKTSNVGSHIDITPSIVELVAPNDFIYHSFGTPLVSNEAVALGERNVALGYFAIATERFIFGNGGSIEYYQEGTTRSHDEEVAKKLYKRLEQARALSWWILKNGYVISDTQESK